MTADGFAWLVSLHGALGVLALAVLLHPVISLRRRRSPTRNTMLTADLGAIGMIATFSLGWWVYPTYRAKVKPLLWLEHPEAVLRFETKEHLAAMAVALAVGGALTLRAGGKHPIAREAAWSQLACAWVLGAAVAVLGSYVRGLAQPGW